MLQAWEAMSNMDELPLFLQKRSERHNSIACAFLVKKKGGGADIERYFAIFDKNDG
jgi:hypothetical protein